MNQRTYNWLIIIILITFIVVLVLLLFEIKSEGGQCIQSPVSYCANHLAESAGGPIACTCTAKVAGNSQLLFFDSDGKFSLSNP